MFSLFFFKENLPFVSVPLINLQVTSTLLLIGGGRTNSQALLWEIHAEKQSRYFKTLIEHLSASCVSGTVHLGMEALRRCNDQNTQHILIFISAHSNQHNKMFPTRRDQGNFSALSHMLHYLLYCQTVFSSLNLQYLTKSGTQEAQNKCLLSK